MLFAQAGHNVTATDASEGMLQVAADKAKAAGVDASVTAAVLNFNELDKCSFMSPFMNKLGFC